MELLSEKTFKLTKEAVKELFPDFSSYEKLFIRPASDDNFGDFQTNFAMATAGDLRQNPRKTAELLADKLSNHPMFSKVEAAGPGFLNFYISPDFLKNMLMKLDHKKWNFSFLDRKGDVIIDYSSPNIAKPLHVGHLRSTIIGDSLKRINRFLGYSVIADNHIGDWGTQFGKLIYAWRHWRDEDEIKKNPVKEMQRLYALFSEKSREKPELAEEARKELRKLQKNDKEALKLWEMFTSISREDSEKIYKRLGVEFDTWYGESFYRSMMNDIVQELTKKGIAREDDGAIVVFFEDKNLHPCIIQKKDGSFLYATSEIATLKYRVEKYDVNRIINVTDNRQETHFKQIFAIGKKMGLGTPCEHVTFGLMTFDGEVISSRKGNVILLSELLDEAEKRSRSVIDKKNPDLPEKEKKHASKVIGTAAVKYEDLSQNRTSTVDFRWEKALSFEGNTAPYLQYCYARIRSMERKAEASGIVFEKKPEDFVFSEEIEKKLAMMLMRFPETAVSSSRQNKPNFIADYLFSLVQTFSTFYNAHPVLREKEPLRSSRMFLSAKTADTVKQGLELLGIEVVERM